jgi:hypothetical protein
MAELLISRKKRSFSLDKNILTRLNVHVKDRAVIGVSKLKRWRCGFGCLYLGTEWKGKASFAPGRCISTRPHSLHWMLRGPYRRAFWIRDEEGSVCLPASTGNETQVLWSAADSVVEEICMRT